MEGHGWVEREESDIGSRELNVHRSSEIQHGRGGSSFPQTTVMASCWEHAVQIVIFRKCLFRPHTLALSWGQRCSLTSLPVPASLVCEGTVGQ